MERCCWSSLFATSVKELWPFAYIMTFQFPSVYAWQSLKEKWAACIVSQTTSYCLFVKPWCCFSFWKLCHVYKPCGFLWNIFGPFTRVMMSLLQQIMQWFCIICDLRRNMDVYNKNTNFKSKSINKNNNNSSHDTNYVQCITIFNTLPNKKYLVTILLVCGWCGHWILTILECRKW